MPQEPLNSLADRGSDPKPGAPDVDPRAAGGRYYANVRRDMVSFLPDRYSRVLEVGCGEGAFCDLLAPGCEVWGVEPELKSAAVAAQRMHKVLAVRFDDAAPELPLHYFDLVVCNDVIEHLEEPERCLRSIREVLVPGGHVVASIPNVRHWEVLWQLLVEKDWRYVSSGVLDRTHLRFFTERSIRRLFVQTGYEVVQLAGINDVFHPVRRAVLATAALLTLWYWRDVGYRQFGVLARAP
jgi:2-polyprenyl-3-methyl-5-hydroxy-6-metoxy-1,4-benzoquinol methylase